MQYQITEQQHSILAPSSASRWIRCAGSPKAEYGKRETEGNSAKEGRALHEVAFRALEHGTEPVVLDIVEDVIITEEGLNGVRNYIEFVNSVRGPNAQLEKRIDCSVIHSVCFGTGDYWEFFETLRLLRIADYKNGRIDVSPVQNWQMLTYVSGIIDTLRKKLPFYDFSSITIEMTIVQPFSNDGGDIIKQWVIQGNELAQYTEFLRNAAHQAMSDNPICTPDPESCRYCKARLTCSAFNATFENLSVCIASDSLPVDRNLGFTMQRIWQFENMLKALKSAVEAEIFEEFNQGRVVDGIELGSGRGKLEWSEGIGKTVPIAELLGVNIMKAPERITATQAKAELKKSGLPEDLFKEFTVYKQGKQIIKPLDLKKTSEWFGNNN